MDADPLTVCEPVDAEPALVVTPDACMVVVSSIFGISGASGSGMAWFTSFGSAPIHSPNAVLVNTTPSFTKIRAFWPINRI